MGSGVMDKDKQSYSDNISLYALSSKKNNLSRVLIALVGEWHGHEAGSFKLEVADMKQMKDNFDKKLIDVVCDYEHQTLTGETAPASGWIKTLSIEDDNLYAHVEWNKEAKKMIKDKKYKYVSPVIVFNTSDTVSGNNIGCTLHSLSLTNTPFLQELGEVIANKAQESISMKNEVISLKEQVKKLIGELNKVKKDKAEFIVNKAIDERRLKPSQKEFALNLALQNAKSLESFIADISVVVPPPNNIFGDIKTFKQKTAIEEMVIVASQTKI